MILASMFRDSAATVDRYVDQVKALREHMDVKVIAVEGDSYDDTYDRLMATDFKVLKVEVGGPRYGSVDWRPRWRQLAVCGNAALNAAAFMIRGHEKEPFCWLESDLICEPETIVRLVDDLSQVSAVAPMSYQGDRCYETWGHVKDGMPFSARPPYHAGIVPGQLTPIDSAGSCFVMLGRLITEVNFSPVDCIRGIGRDLSEAGYQLYLDPTVSVRHPE